MPCVERCKAYRSATRPLLGRLFERPDETTSFATQRARVQAKAQAAVALAIGAEDE